MNLESILDVQYGLRTQIRLPPAVQTGPHRSLPIGTGHGVCVSFLSPDDLDRKAVEHAVALTYAKGEFDESVAADIGCSPYMPQAIRFAKIGTSVQAFDAAPPINELNSLNEELGGRIQYLQTDVRHLENCELAEHYDIIYASRLLSHLRFEEAQSLLRTFIARTRLGSRFFLSFGSLKSTLADAYPHRERPVQERFAAVRNTRTAGSSIEAPLCLYTIDDVHDLLLQDFRLTILEQFCSKLGTIKIIATVTE